LKHNISILLTVLLLIFTTVFFHASTYFILLVLSIFFLLSVIVIFGSSFIQLNYFINNINNGITKGISITFDDGIDAELTPQILDVLKKENVKATFFVIGNKIEQQKSILLRIHNEGHIIGNHSFSHTKKLTLFTTAKLKADILKCSNIIKTITKQNPIYFRPPYGITTPRYKRALNQLGLISIGWSVRSLDTVIKDKEKLYNKVTRKITKGSIVLFHDTQKVTLDILPNFIHYCKNNGINIVSLPELITENND